MNDFLQHIGQLTGTARQPQITRITPLVPSPTVTPLDFNTGISLFFLTHRISKNSFHTLTAPLPHLNEEQLLQIQQDPRQAIEQRIRTMELLQRQMTETLSQLRQISAILPSLSRSADTGPGVTSTVFSDSLGGPSSSSQGVETTHQDTTQDQSSSAFASGQSSSVDKGKGKAPAM
jgi:hypothetical protein